MQYGFVIPGGDVRAAVDLAVEAEAAGWDGVFIPDCISIETAKIPASPGFDPRVVLAAMVKRTERVRLGTMVTAVPRAKVVRGNGALGELLDNHADVRAQIGDVGYHGGVSWLRLVPQQHHRGEETPPAPPPTSHAQRVSSFVAASPCRRKARCLRLGCPMPCR